MSWRKWINEHPKVIVFVALLSLLILAATKVVISWPDIRRTYDHARQRRLARKQRESPLIKGKLIFEKIPLRVKDLSGSIQPLKKSGNVLRCGDALDVMWRPKAVLFMKEEGLFEQVLAVADAPISDLEWDGRNVWLSRPPKGIWILDTSGKTVATVRRETALPPCERALLLHVIEPGKVFATGSFGPHSRAWCAIVEYDNSQTSVNVFHQARRVRSSGTNKVSRDPLVAFTPDRVCERQMQGRRKLLVARCEKKYARHALIYPLEIHLDDLSVSVSSQKWPFSRRRSPKLEYKGMIYVPAGAGWHRIDPNTRKREELVTWNWLPDSYASLSDYWISAHYGMAAWSKSRELYQIRVTDQERVIAKKSVEPPAPIVETKKAPPRSMGRRAFTEQTEGTYLRRFSFEGENGPITNAHRLSKVVIKIERQGEEPVGFRYIDYEDGGYFPLGTYTARQKKGTPRTGRSRPRKFEPIEVTSDTVTHLVFKIIPEPKTIYSGQVLNAITGKAMEGAFVMTGFEGNLAWITSQEWEQLHRLPTKPSLNDEALWPVKNISGSGSLGPIGRTNSDGRFEIALSVHEMVYEIVAFEEDYLSTRLRRDSFGTSRNGRVDLQPMPLFPAAKVMIEPQLDCRNFFLGFVPDENDYSRKAAIFFNMYGGYSSGPEARMVGLARNQRQPYHVPAEVSFKMKFSIPYDDECCIPEIPGTVRLEQGEVLDLGRFVFEPAIKIFVKVVDASGKAIEGIHVTRWFDDPYHNIRKRKTDAKGRIQYNVEPNSKVRFTLFPDTNNWNVRKEVALEIGGRDYSGKEFVIGL